MVENSINRTKTQYVLRHSRFMIDDNTYGEMIILAIDKYEDNGYEITSTSEVVTSDMKEFSISNLSEKSAQKLIETGHLERFHFLEKDKFEFILNKYKDDLFSSNYYEILSDD